MCSKKIVTVIYENISEEIKYLKEAIFGESSPEQTIGEAAEIIQETGFPEEAKLECALIALQLNLLNKIGIPEQMRSLKFEMNSRDWASLDESKYAFSGEKVR